MATTAVSGGGRAEAELKLMNEVDPACKNFRKVLQQNSKESSECVRQHRYLDRQKRSIHAKLSREEKELRDQLRRLQDEKKMLDLRGDEFDHADTTSVIDDEGCRDEEAVVNPYPVCFPGRKISAPSRTGWSQENLDEGMRSASRAVSFHNVADLDGLDYPSCSPVSMSSACLSSLLPPLHSSSRLRTHASSGQGSPGWEGPGVSPDEGVGPWLGDPEAIASVRRPRKSVAQQRKDQHIWSRSSSLKEARSSRSRMSCSSVISRSNSMREKYRREYSSGSLSHDGSPQSLSRSSSGMFSPSGSFKKSSFLRSIESLTDSVNALDVSPTQQGIRIKNLKTSEQDSNPSTPESPNIVSEEIYKLRQKGHTSDILTISVEAPSAEDMLPPISLGANSPDTPPSPLSLKPPGVCTAKIRSPRGSLKKRRGPVGSDGAIDERAEVNSEQAATLKQC